MIERIDIYLKHKGYTDNKFITLCGLSVGTLSQARRNKGDLSHKSVEKIISACKDLNRTWLLTGDGEMILTPTIQNDNSQVTGSYNTGSTVSVNNQSNIDAMLSMIKEQQRQNAETQKQNAKLQNMMDRFLTIMEKKDEN